MNGNGNNAVTVTPNADRQSGGRSLYLNFEREILLHVFDDQYEKWQLDGESFLWVGRTRNVRHTAKRNTDLITKPTTQNRRIRFTL